MTTQVTVQYDGDRLLERSRQQQQAARQVKSSNDRIKAAASTDKAQQQRAGTLPQQQAQRYSTLEQRLRVRDEPAASIKKKTGDFGFIDVGENSTGANADPFFTNEYKIPAGKRFKNYRIVRIVIGAANDVCVGSEADPASFFFGRIAELAQFVSAGGVAWINSEFSGCGIQAETLNAYIQDAFQATIGFVDDVVYTSGENFGPFIDYPVIRSQLVYTAQTGIAPPYYYNAAFCTISGGTPYYATEYNEVTCAFEQIGQGFLVLAGDSNGTSQFPSYTEGSTNFIEALLAL
jgi:hypothetical protein